MFSWLEDVVEAVSPNAWIAAGVLFLGPLLLPTVGRGLRPLAKGAIKGYLTVQDKVKEYAAVSAEQLSDLVAEARSEHGAAVAGAASAVAAEEASGTGTKERKTHSGSSGSKEKTA